MAGLRQATPAPGSEKVVPALEKFKFNHFGHDLIVLHEHEIRKETGAFNCFRNRDEQRQFITGLTNLIDASNFVLISCVIDKRQLQAIESLPPNPYHIALGSCLETLYQFLQEKHQDHATIHVLVECRGKKEDADLELEFRRICSGANRLQSPFLLKLYSLTRRSTLLGCNWRTLWHGR